MAEVENLCPLLLLLMVDQVLPIPAPQPAASVMSVYATCSAVTFSEALLDNTDIWYAY